MVLRGIPPDPACELISPSRRWFNVSVRIAFLTESKVFLNDVTIENLDPVRWIAIGMAIADKRFAKRLFTEVDIPRAFDHADLSANLAELMMLGDDTRRQFMQELGYDCGVKEKLSDAIIRVLVEADRESWRTSSARAEILAREIQQALCKLTTLARRKT